MAVAYNFAFCICPVKIFCNTWEDCFLADRVLEIPTQQWGVQYISFPMPQAGKEPNGKKKKKRAISGNGKFNKNEDGWKKVQRNQEAT